MRTFVIAEAGVNHNGSESLALALVDVAAQCGADAVKFQTFSADRLVKPGAEKAAYQKAATGDGDQHAMLKQLELSEETYRRLVERCQAKGIEFMSTPFDEEAADFLLSLGMQRIKVPSGEITNLPFLRFLAAKDCPMIVSTGMASLDEVLIAVREIADERQRRGFLRPLAEMLCLLHCTSNYPAAAGDVNLRAMQTMAEATGLPVGYSDHTLGVAISTAAVALGAGIIEKHFTLDHALPGPDQKASLLPEELALLVRQTRAVELALGSPVKAPSAAEMPVRAVARRSVTLVCDVEAGARLRSEDVRLLRPGTGIPPGQMDEVIGRLAKIRLAAGTTLQWDYLVERE